jgi:hypothetical protein
MARKGAERSILAEGGPRSGQYDRWWLQCRASAGPSRWEGGLPVQTPACRTSNVHSHVVVAVRQTRPSTSVRNTGEPYGQWQNKRGWDESRPDYGRRERIPLESALEQRRAVSRAVSLRCSSRHGRRRTGRHRRRCSRWRDRGWPRRQSGSRLDPTVEVTSTEPDLRRRQSRFGIGGTIPYRSLPRDVMDERVLHLRGPEEGWRIARGGFGGRARQRRWPCSRSVSRNGKGTAHLARLRLG